MAITTFPNSAVCQIIDDIPGVGEFQGSGVIIGPHTILTASHLLWDGAAGIAADKVSVYPGYVPDGSDYNPTGALGGTQAIHFMRVADNGDSLAAKGTQSDYAVIDTSADLTPYGQFALDPHFKGGDVVVNGYPAASNGYQQGDEKTVATVPAYSDLDTRILALSAGYSGGPIWDKIESGGTEVPAVVGLVSTADYGTRLTARKVQTIDHWIQSDAALWSGGTPPQGTVPQLDGTAASPAFAYRETTAASPAATLAAAVAASTAAIAPVGGDFAALVEVLHRTQSSTAEASLAPPASAAAASLTGPAVTTALPDADTAPFGSGRDLRLGLPV